MAASVHQMAGDVTSTTVALTVAGSIVSLIVVSISLCALLGYKDLRASANNQLFAGALVIEIIGAAIYIGSAVNVNLDAQRGPDDEAWNRRVCLWTGTLEVFHTLAMATMNIVFWLHTCLVLSDALGEYHSRPRAAGEADRSSSAESSFTSPGGSPSGTAERNGLLSTRSGGSRAEGGKLSSSRGGCGHEEEEGQPLVVAAATDGVHPLQSDRLRTRFSAERYHVPIRLLMVMLLIASFSAAAAYCLAQKEAYEANPIVAVTSNSRNTSVAATSPTMPLAFGEQPWCWISSLTGRWLLGYAWFLLVGVICLCALVPLARARGTSRFAAMQEAYKRVIYVRFSVAFVWLIVSVLSALGRHLRSESESGRHISHVQSFLDPALGSLQGIAFLLSERLHVLWWRGLRRCCSSTGGGGGGALDYDYPATGSEDTTPVGFTKALSQIAWQRRQGA